MMKTRDYYISRLLYCQDIFRWNKKEYFIYNFDALSKLRAEVIYESTIKKLSYCISQDDIIPWMVAYKYWSESQENALSGFKLDIEKIKIEMFGAHFESNKRESLRKMLRKAESEATKLESIKNQFNYITREGIALHQKTQYLIGTAIKDASHKRFLKDGFWDKRLHPIIGHATNHYLNSRLSERQIRDLARNEPWQSIWASHDVVQLFKCEAGDLSEEQKALIMWTRAYENARSSGELSSNIIHDDDLFDGWLLKQNKDKQVDEDRAWLDKKLANTKVAGHEHIFVMAETEEDIKRLNNLNDKTAKATKQILFKEIDQHGQLKDQDTSIGQSKLREQYIAQRSARAKMR